MTSSSKGTALITGASSGIGLIYADRLAQQGYNLVLVARTQQRLDEAAARLAKKTGRTVQVVVADLTAKQDLERVERILDVDPDITMLVNNAGFGSGAGLLDSDPDRLDDMIRLNVIALTRLTRAVAPRLVERGRGTIVNVASSVALMPEILNGTYSGTKAYVLNFTQSLRKELASKGVQVQAVLPGATRTAFWDVAGVPMKMLPASMIMDAEAMVDAALAGLAMNEAVTIPSLPDVQGWGRFEEARVALHPHLSLDKAAARYSR